MADTVDRLLHQMLEANVMVLIEELGDSNSHYVLAKIQKFDPVSNFLSPEHPSAYLVLKVTQDERKSKWWQWWHPPFLERRMTNRTLQEFMKNMMKKDTLSGQLENINEMMSRIWAEARKYFPVADML